MFLTLNNNHTLTNFLTLEVQADILTELFSTL